MKKVLIKPGCITCGTCEFIAPEVFEVTDICRVKDNAYLQDSQEAIRQAIAQCPVNVIEGQE
ncbi:MAG: ferredoxin [Candidatus Babeliaceae bacterium]|nr:ferredoxin [Candidatus Babeliaceae bacterium]